MSLSPLNEEYGMQILSEDRVCLDTRFSVQSKLIMHRNNENGSYTKISLISNGLLFCH